MSTWLAGEEIWNNFDFVVSAQDPTVLEETWTILSDTGRDHFIVDLHRNDLSALEIYTIQGDLVRVHNGLHRDQILVNTVKYPVGTYVVQGVFKNGDRISELVVVNR